MTSPDSRLFVDASALLAILLQEPEAAAFADRIEAAERSFTSPIALFETTAALMTRRALPRALVAEVLDALLAASGIEVVALGPESGLAALDAFERYGKGRGHPAQLNMGDCFAYAAATLSGASLLYKGQDFARTDLA